MAFADLPTLDAGVHEARPNAKPLKREPKARTGIVRKAKPQGERDRIAEIRDYVFARERGICRCCRRRRAESMHEIKSRGAGGKVSKRNSIAVCGQLRNGHECHGRCQRKQIVVTWPDEAKAETTLTFTPTDAASADWLKVKLGEEIVSAPMREYEQE